MDQLPALRLERLPGANVSQSLYDKIGLTCQFWIPRAVRVTYYFAKQCSVGFGMWPTRLAPLMYLSTLNRFCELRHKCGQDARPDLRAS